VCGSIQLTSTERLSTAQAVAQLLPDVGVPFGGFARNERPDYWRPRVCKGFWCWIEGFAEHGYWFLGKGQMRVVQVQAHPRTFAMHGSKTELRVVTRAASRLVKPIHDREPVIRWSVLPRCDTAAKQLELGFERN